MNVVLFSGKGVPGELRDVVIVSHYVVVEHPQVFLLLMWEGPAKVDDGDQNLCSRKRCLSHPDCFLKLWDGHSIRILCSVVKAKRED